MTANVAGASAFERPTTGDFASVEVDGQQLCWSPWAPPLLLNERAAAIRDALDGSELVETAEMLAEIERRPIPAVLGELRSVVRSLLRHGVLRESVSWPRPTHAALRRPITPCDIERYQLDHASLFDLELGSRRITVSVAGSLADELREALPLPVLEATEPLSDAAHEFAIVPAATSRDFHLLYGRGVRVYQRSLDPAVVIRSMVLHLWSMQWTDRHASELVWLDAHCLVRDGRAVLVPGPLRYLWPNMATRLTRAGYRQVESVQIGLDPGTGLVVTPPSPPDEYLEALGRLGVERPLPHPSEQLHVAWFHDMVRPEELEALQTSGNDACRLPLALLTYRLSLLAYRGAAGASPEVDVDLARAHDILVAIAALARQPELVASVHGDHKALVSALCS